MREGSNPPQEQGALRDDQVRLLGGIAQPRKLESQIPPKEDISPLGGRGSLRNGPEGGPARVGRRVKRRNSNAGRSLQAAARDVNFQVAPRHTLAYLEHDPRMGN